MSSVYETIQEEVLGSSDPVEAPAVEIPVAVYNSVHSVHIADDSDGTDMEWNDERGIVAMRRYGAFKNEADDAVMESKRISKSWKVRQPFITACGLSQGL